MLLVLRAQRRGYARTDERIQDPAYGTEDHCKVVRGLRKYQ
jgi:hypothetical protein